MDFNRNLNELKRTKKEADRLGVKTCLLIKEGCMPECPFKTEHDCWQGDSIRYEGKSYWDIVPFTCNTWRGQHAERHVANPRTATDIMIHSKEDWDEFKSEIRFDYLKDTHFMELQEAEIFRNRIELLRDMEEYKGMYLLKFMFKCRL